MTPVSPGRIRAVISDVDGTLVTKAKVLTDRARQAVAALRVRGILFAIVSSRPPRGLAGLIAPLALTTPIAGFNGGTLARPDLSTLAEHLIAPDVATRAVAKLKSIGADIWVFARGEWFLTNLSAPHIETERLAVQFGPTQVADFGDTLTVANKIVGVSADHTLLASSEAEMQMMFGAQATVVRSQAYYLDITTRRPTRATLSSRSPGFWLCRCKTSPS